MTLPAGSRIAAAVGALLMTLGAAPAAHAAETATVEGQPAVPGTQVVEWGKTKDGELYSFTYLAGESKPKEVAAAARCSIYISDVKFYGSGASAWFQWETSQICSGNYGWQYIRTQMWRSSWSGPRGYTPWHQTPKTTKSYIDYGWSADCNDGGGTYTYYPVMKGVASFGSSPTTRADNELRKNCGTYRP
ncbi:hypothetical protein [Streptomyces poriticola]|uniref:hypothetical protein n=1 Tax=Streptomyces poriticola TaxID=3120506 RepID=UPI002FCDE26D